MATTPIDAEVTPEELAALIAAFDDGKPRDEPAAEDRRRLYQARRILERLSERRWTDAQRHAINRLRSEAHSIAEDAQSAVESALQELDESGRTHAGSAAVLALIQRLDDDGHVDLIAGTSPLEDALRRARLEARSG